jgi:hypothetical protein
MNQLPLRENRLEGTTDFISYDRQATIKSLSNDTVQQQKLIELVVQHDLPVPVMARILHVAETWVTKELRRLRRRQTNHQRATSHEKEK